mgnify:CR=1 FL=1
MIRQHHGFCLVLSDAGFFGSLLTSFREIISVIGRIRVWIRCGYDPSGSESNNDVVQVKYTNQVTAYAVAGIDTCF